MADEKRTLYVSGFPMDVRYREVRNTFLHQRGFDYCRLVEGGRVPIAFVTFKSQADALQCKDIMHGCKLDEESTVELRLELAKSDRPYDNPRKRSVGGPPPVEAPGSSKRIRTNDTSNTTLYFYGLSADTVESEIKQLCVGLPGFVRNRWSPSKRSGGTPVGYADFSTSEYAAAALEQLNGTAVASVSDGICVRFADVAADRRTRPAPSRGPPAGGAYFPYGEVYAAYGQVPAPMPGYPEAPGQFGGYGQFNPYSL